MESIIEYGPMPHESMISGSVDYYKFTMSQFFFENIPQTQVAFKDTNRSGVNFSEYVDPSELQQRLDFIGDRGFSEQELQYLREVRAGENNERVFSDEYVDYLGYVSLPRPVVALDEKGDISVEVEGSAPIVTFWETIILAEKNELYYRGLMESGFAEISDSFQEGDERLTEKINRIKEYNQSLLEGVAPLMITEFGTRRRFSSVWQNHVITRLKEEIPQYLSGTSNLGMASVHDLPPIGTFAHELIMVFTAINGRDDNDQNLRSTQQEVLRMWSERYPYYRVALSDTYGTDAFFEDFKEVDPNGEWVGTRHDSGDPFMYIEKVVRHYEDIGVDPRDKIILFSDGLDVEKMIDLHKATDGKNRIKSAYGIGTNLTNDLGVAVLSQVMKAVAADQEETCKVSDNARKATGSTATQDRYFRVFGVEAEELRSSEC